VDQYALVEETLSAPERAALAEQEAIVARGLRTFYDVGNALAQIRDGRLYRATHPTFAAYCRERWGVLSRTAYDLIGAAGVVDDVQDPARIGPTTCVMHGHMHPPDGSHAKEKYAYLLPPNPTALLRYRARLEATHARARAAGLVYSYHSDNADTMHCHACGGLLLQRHAPATPDGSTCPYELRDETEDRCVMFQGGCDCWDHTQRVTDGRCDHCGAAVPIVTLPAAELAALRRQRRDLPKPPPKAAS
jgi:hypothetical protein